MNKMLLTNEELIELTGKHRREMQQCTLRHLGIEHRLRPDGSIVVLRKHVEKSLGDIDNKRERSRIEPNWGALNA
ncbi:MAG: DUF4224 domain-containing protein [Pseudomonadota bacterium]